MTRGGGPELEILAESPHWVVVAKPPRLLVHRRARTRDQHFALQLVRDQLGRRVHPVHRLDRATSGCLLLALEPAWHTLLQAALAAPTARKRYLAFVRGAWLRPRPVTVTRPMKDTRGRVRHALTEVRCLSASVVPRCSLLEAAPATGRYHQVRRHVRDLNHPVLGDGEHGDSRVNRWWREHYALPRLGLHCHALDLPLPDGTRLKVSCPPFADLAALWRRMPWWATVRRALPTLDLPPLPVPDMGHQ